MRTCLICASLAIYLTTQVTDSQEDIPEHREVLDKHTQLDVVYEGKLKLEVQL